MRKAFLIVGMLLGTASAGHADDPSICRNKDILADFTRVMNGSEGYRQKDVEIIDIQNVTEISIDKAIGKMVCHALVIFADGAHVPGMIIGQYNKPVDRMYWKFDPYAE